MSDIVSRLEACKFGLFWPEARDAIAEITRLQKEIETARESGTLEIDDGCVIWRDGPTSITICAETVTIFNSDSGEPAVKVPLTQDDVFRALKDKEVAG